MGFGAGWGLARAERTRVIPLLTRKGWQFPRSPKGGRHLHSTSQPPRVISHVSTTCKHLKAYQPLVMRSEGQGWRKEDVVIAIAVCSIHLPRPASVRLPSPVQCTDRQDPQQHVTRDLNGLQLPNPQPQESNPGYPNSNYLIWGVSSAQKHCLYLHSTPKRVQIGLQRPVHLQPKTMDQPFHGSVFPTAWFGVASSAVGELFRSLLGDK